MQSNKEDKKIGSAIISTNRSTNYPSIAVSSAIDSIQELYKNNGTGPYTREEIALGLGYSGISGVSASKIAALAYFGLIEKKDGKYILSQISKQILFPQQDDTAKEQRLAIQSAVRQPKLYADLIKQYEGQALPLMLENILIHQFGIQPKASKSVATNFRYSLEFSGLLKDGILITQNEQEEEMSIAPEHTDENPTNKNSGDEKKQPDLVVNLSSGITIKFPAQLSLELSTGHFSEGIKLLEQSATKLVKTGTNDEKEGA